MTGVVTEVNIFFPTVKTACDCIGICIKNITTCTNWVFKHTFVPGLDHGKRSCTIYSSPNLPTDVTLAYNVTGSVNTALLAMNPQTGGTAPLTFADAALTKPDPFGVSGFITQDQNLKIYCWRGGERESGGEMIRIVMRISTILCFGLSWEPNSFTWIHLLRKVLLCWTCSLDVRLVECENVSFCRIVLECISILSLQSTEYVYLQSTKYSVFPLLILRTVRILCRLYSVYSV